MEAKDRLIDELRIHSILADERGKPNRSIIRAMKQLRKEQDEISFKAGIKEVVDWLEANATDIFRDYLQHSTLWQAQLKEWGIKEGQ